MSTAWVVPEPRRTENEPKKASVVRETNPDLLNERGRSRLPVRELTYYLDGGKRHTALRERMEAIVEADPVFDRSPADYNRSRPEQYRAAMRKQRRLLELRTSHGLNPDEYMALRLAVHDEIGTDLQELMFIPNLLATFNDEQQARWVDAARRYEMLGCYCQTELGHGSNVRGLETTATYLPETDEIEIHSPTLSSTKWWPGALGRTANHAIVYARLVVHGRDLGVHNFLVPLRDVATHAPLPGVSVGDIGAKIGYNVQDNGYCRFERVRIPRTNMAMRHVRLERGGEYVPGGVAGRNASYSSMTFVRSMIVWRAGYWLAVGATIATRYSAVRRQGFADGAGGAELQVLDYPMQQARLLPQLATAFAFHATGAHMLRLLREGNAEALHVASAGLKALCSRLTCEGLETCRLACGGHGFLASSALPDVLGTYKQNATVEGENYMIAQQTTRGLLKALAAAAAPAPAPAAAAVEGGHAHFVANARAHLGARCAAAAPAELCGSAAQASAFAQRAASQLLYVQRRLQQEANKGLGSAAAWNACAPEIVRCSDAYCLYVLVRNFGAAVDGLDARGSPLAPPLRKCFDLFALWHMQQGLGEFVEAGYLRAEQAELVREGVRQQLRAVRPDAVALCDAWGHSDHALNSTIGRYDGNVYEALYASAQPAQNPMNAQLVDAAFAESLLPMRARADGAQGAMFSRL